MATDIQYSLGDYVGVARRRWIYLATLLPGAILIAVYLAFTLPPLYQSSATILLEASSIPQDLIRTTVTAYADEQIERVQRSVLTIENLTLLAEELGPYPDETELSVRDRAMLISQNTHTERVDPITLKPLPESDAFSIFYDNPDPDLALQVTSRLADMFLSHNRETRTQQAMETYTFLQAQSEEENAKIAELEQRLANFKEKYCDALPESRVRNQQAADRVERELETLNQRILLTNERKRSREVGLSQINPNLFDPAGDWRAELAALRAELAAAQQRYTPDHPDVRRLRRSIEALATRVDQSPPSNMTPDNPDYIMAANQLDTVKSELAGLRSSASRAQQQIDDYERSLRIAPEVEREYSQLNREYQLAQDRFASIEESRSEAALGTVLESEARGERLTLIRAPYRANKPYSPNRLGIILLAIVLGGGLGVGLAAMAEASDPTIRSMHDLAGITDIKALATVPYMLNPVDKRKRAIVWGAASVIATVAVLFVVSVVYQAVV